MEKIICNCACLFSPDYKAGIHCFSSQFTVFDKGRVKISCLNYEPPPEIKKITQCSKCGELLATPEELEAGMCIGCLANKGGGNDPETEKKGDELP